LAESKFKSGTVFATALTKKNTTTAVSNYMNEQQKSHFYAETRYAEGGCVMHK